ncbi:MAG: serine/threonine-protein phosphatase, partial [Acidimicrobiaceae bacterium]|nr:serine/threonine-protein phosphatase [Acidimicrobiaceae bacterium]
PHDGAGFPGDDIIGTRIRARARARVRTRIRIRDDDTIGTSPHDGAGSPDGAGGGWVVMPCEASRGGVVDWGASSVMGLRRRTNQDRYLRQGTTFAVADGMGGLSGGSEASSAVVELVTRRVAAFSCGAPLTKWESMARTVNREARERIRGLGLADAGCTLTLAAVEPDRVVVAHVGDSRLYDYEQGTGELSQRTSDHNLLSELQARGKSLRHAAEKGLPLAGLVSYVGMPDDELRIEVFSWSPAPQTRLLLCSDGVHGCLGRSEIAEVLATFPARDAAVEFTERADAAGGRDNATAVVVDLL